MIGGTWRKAPGKRTRAAVVQLVQVSLEPITRAVLTKPAVVQVVQVSLEPTRAQTL